MLFNLLQETHSHLGLLYEVVKIFFHFLFKQVRGDVSYYGKLFLTFIHFRDMNS